MALLTNPHPKDNPIAIKIPIDTIINNISLDPQETYNVIVNSLVCNQANMNQPNLYTPIFNASLDNNVKRIRLYDSYSIKIYLPLFDNGKTIYIVPSRYDIKYEFSSKDLVSLNEISADYSYAAGGVNNWSEALEYWLYNINGFNKLANKPTKTTTMKQDLTLSIKGVDTNRSDKTKNITITLQSLAKKLGV